MINLPVALNLVHYIVPILGVYGDYLSIFVFEFKLNTDLCLIVLIEMQTTNVLILELSLIALLKLQLFFYKIELFLAKDDKFLVFTVLHLGYKMRCVIHQTP